MITFNSKSISGNLKILIGILFFSLFAQVSYGQLSNCPDKVVNIFTGTPSPCQADYSVSGITTTSGNPIEYYSYGATIIGAPGSELAISDLEAGRTFNYGVSQIVITDGVDQCEISLIVTETVAVPTDFCDDITIDIAGTCEGEYVLPDDIDLSGDLVCELFAEGAIEISFDGAGQKVFMVSAINLTSPVIPATVTITKAANTITCTKNITVTDSTVPELICASGPIDVEVAAGCGYVYSFDYEGLSTIPCGSSYNQLQGDPSGTILGVGSYTYEFEIFDDVNSTQTDVCSWVVNVIESETVATQLNCLTNVNISIDETCEATIDATNLLAGNLCTDISGLTLSATLADGTILEGSSITFNQEQLGNQIDVTVSDPNGINSCWSTVNIEDKFPPSVLCPADATISCLDASGIDILGSATVVGAMNTESCVVDIDYIESNIFYRCEGDYQNVITRLWYGTDSNGNRSTACAQTIYVERESLNSAVYPPHWDGLDIHTGIQDNGVTSNPSLACDGAGTEWATEEREDGRIVPSPFDKGMVPGTGEPSGIGSCGTIFSFYNDLIIDVCNDNCSNYNITYKVLRTWDVFDWCTGEFRLHEQLIKVADEEAPVFTTEVPDFTISTDIWGCGAVIDLPEVVAEDQCSSDITYSWGASRGTYDPILNKIYFTGNALTTPGNEIEITASATDCCGNVSYSTGYITVVDLVPPVVTADEHTVVTLNNQEGDGSTKVFVDSFDDGSFDGCTNIDWWVRRMDNACEGYDGLNADGTPNPDEIDEVNDFHKYVHFCCEDVAEEQRVIFMVCDDADNDGTPELNGDDNCSSAMIIVDVQDKLAPTVVCPAPVTINCIEFQVYEEFMGTDLTEEQVEALNARFGTPYSNSTCGELGMQSFSGNDECGIGTATRTISATSSNGTASCNQSISVITSIENVLSCDRISFPTLSQLPYNYDWCDPFDTIAPFAFAIEVDGCTDIILEEPVIDRDDLCTEVGISVTLDTFNFAGGGCKKILAHWEVIDQCLFEENFLTNEEINPFVSANGYYEIYVEYDIFDTDPPVIECEKLLVETADCEKNYDTFTLSVTDDCTDPEFISVTYKIDFDNDGSFDFPDTEAFAEGNSFDSKTVDGLPVGNHAIRWVAHDGCGNYSVCVQEIDVVRRIKEPTPYCYLGLSSAVMDEQFGCSVEMWATDFVPDQGTGACGEVLTYRMIPYQDILGDPADESDDLSNSEAFAMSTANWTFGCEYIENGVSHNIEIRIYAVDENGIYDYCDASLRLNDNFDCCEDLETTAGFISGNLKTEDGLDLTDVRVAIESDLPEFPKFNQTDADGSFLFNNIPTGNDYKISAEDNTNPRNGVSTLDLVLIQRHILGITPLDSPYKIIAADINNSSSISASDLLQLRKLILGLYENDEFPNNDSWRFIDNSYVFGDLDNPFPFNEIVRVNNMDQSSYNQNFVGIKIGDVNGTISELIRDDVQVRNGEDFQLILKDELMEKGSRIEIPVMADKNSILTGMQFGLSLENQKLRFTGIQEEGLNVSEENVAISDEGLTFSWNDVKGVSLKKGQSMFVLTFEVLKDVQASSAIALDNNLLKAEAYNEYLQTEEVKVTFRNEDAVGFEVFQNEPNPFTNNTTISFVSPKAGNAYLKVFDVSGKVVLMKENIVNKGLNSFVIYGNELNTNGVLYYQITQGTFNATRKMILLD